MRIEMMILGVIIFLSACGGKDDLLVEDNRSKQQEKVELNLAAEKEKLDQNSRLWASQGFSTYSFSYDIYCYCPVIQKQVLVEDQTVTYAWDEAEQKKVDDIDLDKIETIERLFDWVNRLISERPYNIAVQYDSEYGYPKSIVYDGELQIADDELEIEVSSFDAGVHSGAQFHLTRSKDIWNAGHIRDYRFIQEVICEDCAFSGQVSAVIESEKVANATSIENDVLLDETQLVSIKSIADIFEFIQLHIESNAASVEVEYDEQLAYPLRVKIDVDDGSTADDIEYVTTGFEYDIASAAQDKLDANKLKWESVSNGYYFFVFETSELTDGSRYEISVEGDTLAAVSLSVPELASRDVPEADWDQLMTVDDMFSFIQSALDGFPGVIPSVEYHPVDGYPRALKMDALNGEEFTWRVASLYRSE